MDRKAIIVLGMRSGSSLVTGILQMLGVELGGPLLQPSPDNPKGFFELAPLVRFNEKLVDWKKPRIFLGSELDEHVDKLEEIITRDIGEGQLIGLKDPRITCLLPLYYKVLKSMGYEVKVLIVRRNPHHVARSIWLQQRGRGHKTLPFPECTVIARYYEKLYDFYKDSYFAKDLLFDQVIKSPELSALGLASLLDIPKPNSEVLRAVSEFVDPALDRSSKKSRGKKYELYR